ncbi:MAG: hypothetical protein KF773_26520 [Deltaproteobacteria bacterium]|nr:hypothetical protein [Deltaproteobacteria bacterium]
MHALAANPSRTPPGSALARSHDGRWLVVANAGTLWLADTTTFGHTPLELRPGHDVALTNRRVWIARESTLHSAPLARGGCASTAVALDLPDASLAAAASAIVVASDRGTYLVRDGGDHVELCPRRTAVRAIGETRFLMIDGGAASIVDVAPAAPHVTRLALSAPILDAAPLLDRTTCVLLLDRRDRSPGEQELAVMRANGSVLLRIRVARVTRLAAAARAFIVALATDDGRVIVYDLRERGVVSADRVTGAGACEIALDPDGKTLHIVARRGDRAQLSERHLRGAPPS